MGPNVVQKSADVAELLRCRSLVFTHQVHFPGGHKEPTWQAILENGMAANPSARKDPKYVTHGLHAYKGKFYPQLAKGLINQLRLPYGARILDPFCGSGTTLLEGHLNGYMTYGCDLHPLAARIARAKTSVLEVDPDVLTEVVATVLEAVEGCAEAAARRPGPVPVRVPRRNRAVVRRASCAEIEFSAQGDSLGQQRSGAGLS
jgi:hypothetical protein